MIYDVVLGIINDLFLKYKLDIRSYKTVLLLDDNMKIKSFSLNFDERNDFSIKDIESINVDIFVDKYLLSVIFQESLLPRDSYVSKSFLKKSELLKELTKYFKKRNC